jgi:hypothetical protein
MQITVSLHRPRNLVVCTTLCRLQLSLCYIFVLSDGLFLVPNFKKFVLSKYKGSWLAMNHLFITVKIWFEISPRLLISGSAN